MPRPKAAGGKGKGSQEQDTAPAPDVAAAAQPADAGAADAAPAKKKRNNNPGVRVQGGRVYDSENGTTCHQCRQKTAEIKAKCTTCTLYFCPKCLENRYHERVEDANATGTWGCPRCRKECNCSNCRKKLGMEATGQLANIAKKAGFGSVRDLLVKNPNAKALQLPRAPSAGPSTDAGPSAGPSTDAGPSADGEPASQAAGGAGARKRAPKRKAAAAAAEEELVDEEALPPREHAMPEAQPLQVHKASAGGTGSGVGSRRQRGAAVWMAGVPDVVAVPSGQAGAELAVVLEFLQVFGDKLQLRSPSLAAFAAELLQPAGEAGAGQRRLLCSVAEDSLVGAVHCRLLELVRAYWNVKGGVGPAGWQGIMRAYYAATVLSQRQAADLRWQHGPPAVAGEIFSRPAGAEEGEEEGQGALATQQSGGEVDGEGDVAMAEGGSCPEAALGVGSAEAVDFPEGGYWALPAPVRVGMLHALVNDALECEELRQLIESSMGDALDEEKERKLQLAGVRKEARQAVARERDQQIALMISGAMGGGLTLEQQQQMLEEAGQRAEAAASSAAAAKVMALTEKVHPPTVRAAVVGTDREGRRYLQLQAAPLLAGGAGIVVQFGGAEGGAAEGASGSAAEALACYPAAQVEAVAVALHPRGRREGPLRAALANAFKLKLPDAAAGAAAPAGAAAEAPAAASQAEEESSAVPPPAADGPPAAQPSGKGAKRAAGRGKSRSPTAGEGSAGTSAQPAPAAARTAAQRGKKRAPGGGTSASPAADDEPGEASAAAPGADEALAAGKRRLQASETGSAAERAAPRRLRSAAPVPVAAATEASADAGAAKPVRQVGARRGRAGAAKAAQQAAASEASLPLKVDDMLSPL